MIKSLSEILKTYNDEYRNLVNSKLGPSGEHPKILLRLSKEEDWNFVCAAMDIIGDSLYAIEHFLKFGLEGPTKYDDIGEVYLRLYGVLNATYIQQQAIYLLFKLNNCPNAKAANEQIKSLEIRSVRHKIGAHSSDYLNFDKNNKTESFVPVRINLTGFNCGYFNNETSKIEKVNLRALLEEHIKLMLVFLDQIYEKSIHTFYRGQDSQIKKYEELLSDMRIEKNGGVVIKSVCGEPKKIIVLTRRET